MDLSILDNDYAVTVISMFIGLYGLTLYNDMLPGYIRNLFNNQWFRVLFLSLLLMHNVKSRPFVAVAIALVFVMTLEYINEQEIKENFAVLSGQI